MTYLLIWILKEALKEQSKMTVKVPSSSGFIQYILPIGQRWSLLSYSLWYDMNKAAEPEALICLNFVNI